MRFPKNTLSQFYLSSILRVMAYLFTVTVVLGSDSPIFEEASTQTGLVFTHFNSAAGKYYLPEITSHGGALLDYDGDGDLDVYLVQGALLGPGVTMDKTKTPYKGADQPMDRLFRNDLTVGADGKPVLKFTDVTDSSGIVAKGYGMGVAVGDVNNDGLPDLYITNLGENQMFLNKGNGRFEDITKQSGTGDPGWGTSAAFFDYDHDGLQDLYLANYVLFDAADHPTCYASSSALDYCGPDAYKPARDKLYRNKGDGVFEDVTNKLKGYTDLGAGLGVITSDFNGDGWIDFYVANDGDPNDMWLNNKDGSFVNEALMAGVALNGFGAAEASMGVAVGDFDGDGDDDLFMTHLDSETNTLYVNVGMGFFEDRTINFGLAAPSLTYTGFGTGWIDVDNDGWLDLLVLNGAVKSQRGLSEKGSQDPLAQPNQLFHNIKGKRFDEITSRAGKGFGLLEVSRGAAFGDIDNDGDADVVVTNNNGRTRLLLNQVGNHKNWLGITSKEGMGALAGTLVELELESGQVLRRAARTDGSYCSANDPRVLVGLGDAKKVKRVRVIWPDQSKLELTAPAVNRYHAVLKPSKTGS